MPQYQNPVALFILARLTGLWTCFDSTGEVVPGGVQPLMFKFCPLEAKHYSVSIPILLKGGEMELLHIEGRGYLLEDPHSPVPVPGEDSRIGAFKGHSLSPVRTVMNSSPVAISEETIWFGDIPAKVENGVPHERTSGVNLTASITPFVHKVDCAP